MMVIMPLVTGGALTALLARFGLRLPASLERMLGLAGRATGGGGSFGLMGEAARMAGGLGGRGGHGGFDGYARNFAHAPGFGQQGGRRGGGWEDSIVGVAKMFL